MTGLDEATDSVPEPSACRPKPELWRPVSEKPTPRWIIALVILLAAVTLPLIGIALEPYFLSTPIGQVEVSVVKVVGGVPADEMPASFQHLVALRDGSQLYFNAERIHRPGETLLVTASQGRFTGKVRLGPERVNDFGTPSTRILVLGPVEGRGDRRVDHVAVSVANRVDPEVGHRRLR